MSALAGLPAATRRLLAGAELRRRGLRVETDDARNDAMVSAFKAGIVSMPGYAGIEYVYAAQRLGERVMAGHLTKDEVAFLDGLPLAPISGREYAEAIAEVMNEF